ncbi:MAG TPA: TonB C-terminal domain-containing protein, partial [Gemmatimonadaceae bacterium]|nr:TonB C-terminal domain-containing protein [Gemmatimonadaceae bacterium]
KSTPSTAPAPQAGGGATGGRGTDVATVRTEGIEFPYPGYLNNIVRQIALRFDPSTRNSALRAEVSFLIHRDGSVSNLRFLTRSGVYAFDLEAQGAVEAAAGAHAFGPLPSGFTDDVLPVIFSFDPSLLR